jgi:hypothetical protein
VAEQADEIVLIANAPDSVPDDTAARVTTTRPLSYAANLNLGIAATGATW